jgi:cytochrome b6-f complex iron-sulfur subunit
MNEDNKIRRRTFVDWLIGAGLVAWVLGFIAPVLSYVWPAQRRGPGVQTVSAGKESDIPLWGGKILAVNGQPVLVVHTPQGFRAFSAICTHLGCVVQWNEVRHQIDCPCHAGVFDINGKAVAGPPPKPLAEYGVAVVNGEVMVKSA